MWMVLLILKVQLGLEVIIFTVDRESKGFPWLWNLQGRKQALPPTRSPSSIPFLTLFQLPGIAKAELWFSCCFRGKNSEEEMLNSDQSHPRESIIRIRCLIYPKNRPQKEKRTGGNKGLSFFLTGGFSDDRLRQDWKRHRSKEATRAFGLRAPIKSRPH